MQVQFSNTDFVFTPRDFNPFYGFGALSYHDDTNIMIMTMSPLAFLKLSYGVDAKRLTTKHEMTFYGFCLAPPPYDPFEDMDRPEYALGLPERMGLRDVPMTAIRPDFPAPIDYSYLLQTETPTDAEHDRMMDESMGSSLGEDDWMERRVEDAIDDEMLFTEVSDDEFEVGFRNDDDSYDPLEYDKDGNDVGDISDEVLWERQTRQIERNEAAGMYDDPANIDEEKIQRVYAGSGEALQFGPQPEYNPCADVDLGNRFDIPVEADMDAYDQRCEDAVQTDKDIRAEAGDYPRDTLSLVTGALEGKPVGQQNNSDDRTAEEKAFDDALLRAATDNDLAEDERMDRLDGNEGGDIIYGEPFDSMLKGPTPPAPRVPRHEMSRDELPNCWHCHERPEDCRCDGGVG